MAPPSSSTSFERCSTCRALDFREIFDRADIPPLGVHIVTIGKGPKHVKRQRTVAVVNCDLCRFFHALAPTYRRRHVLHVRLFDHIPQPAWRTGRAVGFNTRRPFLTVLRKNSRLRYDDDIADEVVQFGLCTFVLGRNPNNPSIQRIDRTVGFDLIKVQLQQCIDTHEQCGRSSRVTTDLGAIQLIDCETCAVVDRTLDEQYLTLSYVWGKGTREPAKNTAARVQFEEAPLTVQDAIRAVQRLGYRYLWIDRYCIDQDDTTARRNMIANMDLIYECSLATIVALHGDNDQAGLPGVSTAPRAPQASISCGDGYLISSGPPITTVIDSSKWNTRGWTYQEARLSRRCLFFSSSQVYFVCRTSTWSEAVPHAPSSTSIANLLNSAQLNGDLFGRKEISSAIDHDRLQYTKRSLTFPDDALNAFRGILRRSTYTTLWGVPVQVKTAPAATDPHSSFALGHLWIKRPSWKRSAHLEAPATTLARRRAFPTWTWASLATDIHQDSHGEQSLYGRYLRGEAVALPHNHADIKFAVETDGDGGGAFEDLPDLLRRCPARGLLPETSPRLRVRGQMVSLRRRRRAEHAWYLLAGKWIYFQPDLRAMATTTVTEQPGKTPWPGQPAADDPEDAEDALVLVQWNDAQKANRTRFLLMLLAWVDEGTAERKGLLTEYRQQWDVEWVAGLPRRSVTFVLQ